MCRPFTIKLIKISKLRLNSIKNLLNESGFNFENISISSNTRFTSFGQEDTLVKSYPFSEEKLHQKIHWIEKEPPHLFGVNFVNKVVNFHFKRWCELYLKKRFL